MIHWTSRIESMAAAIVVKYMVNSRRLSRKKIGLNVFLLRESEPNYLLAQIKIVRPMDYFLVTQIAVAIRRKLRMQRNMGGILLFYTAMHIKISQYAKILRIDAGRKVLQN